MPKSFARALILLLAGVLPMLAHAQQSEMFDNYELHYTVVNSTFVAPEVAASYGITRGKKRAFLNLAVREHNGDTAVTRPMLLQGRTWDLIHGQTFEFKEIREGDAVYYIAEFKFINEEWRFFEIDFRPEGANKTYTFKFKHQLYIN
jgi:hypothetical protein